MIPDKEILVLTRSPHGKSCLAVRAMSQDVHLCGGMQTP